MNILSSSTWGCTSLLMTVLMMVWAKDKTTNIFPSRSLGHLENSFQLQIFRHSEG